MLIFGIYGEFKTDIIFPDCNYLQKLREAESKIWPAACSFVKSMLKVPVDKKTH